jgi:hypothetical protein
MSFVSNDFRYTQALLLSLGMVFAIYFINCFSQYSAHSKVKEEFNDLQYKVKNNTDNTSRIKEEFQEQEVTRSNKHLLKINMLEAELASLAQDYGALRSDRITLQRDNAELKFTIGGLRGEIKLSSVRFSIAIHALQLQVDLLRDQLKNTSKR